MQQRRAHGLPKLLALFAKLLFAVKAFSMNLAFPSKT
jgi:hypothetical protein